MKGNRHLFEVFVMITEFVIINLSCKLAYFFRFGEFGTYDDYYLSFFIIFNLAWIGASLFNNGYDASKMLKINSFFRNLFTTFFLQVFIVFLYIVSVKAQYLSRWYLFYTFCTSLLTIISFRSVLIIGYRYYNSMTYNIRKIVLLGPDSSITELFDFFDSKKTSVYRFLAEINPSLTEEEKDELIQKNITEMKQFCIREQINEIYFSLPLVTDKRIEELSRFADDNFIYFRIVADFKELQRRKVNVDFYGRIPVLSLRKEPLRAFINQTMKRSFDLIFASLVILLVFPILYPIAAIFIKLESSGPVIFKQLRTGINKREFWCYKFRTMELNLNADTEQATKDDVRVTKFGKFLRKTSLDEFPQFINVLKGEMSVVGPRPHMIKHTDEYSRIIDKYLFRHFVSPGITGHAQVNGFRGEITKTAKLKKRIQYDAWYIENWSLFLDIKIILKTIWNLLKGEDNAY